MRTADLVEALVDVGAPGHEVGAGQLGTLDMGTKKPGRSLRREASSDTNHGRKDPLVDPVLNRAKAN
eukprot:14894710-Alexandrium_andersonii.AAC.1